jgi:hypothetical protein
MDLRLCVQLDLEDSFALTKLSQRGRLLADMIEKLHQMPMGWLVQTIEGQSSPGNRYGLLKLPVGFMGRYKLIKHLKRSLLPMLSLKKLPLIKIRAVGQIKSSHEITTVQLNCFR